MPTRNVVLTDEQARMVERLVACGRYQNASEVMRDGLRLLERLERREAARLEALRGAVAEGIADIDAGRYETLRSAEDIDRLFQELGTRPVDGNDG